MERVKQAMERINRSVEGRDQRLAITFEDFCRRMTDNPESTLRNVFQVFHDMVKSYVGEGKNEYPDDPESVGFVFYDAAPLFADGVDHPFFADRLFANRFINHVEALKSGAQQNKIYIFDGPPGCGKSTFLNNLLKKFEEYANTQDGLRYEAVWRLKPQDLGVSVHNNPALIMDRIVQLLGKTKGLGELVIDKHDFSGGSQSQTEFTGEWSMPAPRQDFLEIVCPSHDHPVLVIPKKIRKPFFEELFHDHMFLKKLLSAKEYEWVFRESACTICSAMYQALLERLGSPRQVFSMLHARPYIFNRRLGEGITVFNPGDRPQKQNSMDNPILQNRLQEVLGDSHQVQYLHSRYAKTNNGIYALMDVKSHNRERLIELHNIISEGVHKVDFIEENVNSLFMAVMNPEDKENMDDFQSFFDRIQFIEIPYVLDYETEVRIYRHIFGKQIDARFLPRVLNNFARVIISTRLSKESKYLSEWIQDKKKYHLYCDDDLLLLKMDLYTGHIPEWLKEEERKSFNARMRRKILQEATREGRGGQSGRDSIKVFGEFLGLFSKENSLINMGNLCTFFTKNKKELLQYIPEGFLDSLMRMYHYTVLQEVKESLYYYNQEQINRDLMNYLFALNFEFGVVETCNYTGDRIEITDEYLKGIEARIIGPDVTYSRRKLFRNEIQKEYTTRTLTQEVMIENKPLTETALFNKLLERYIHHLKEKVLDPLLKNENFRRAIQNYGTDEFKTYDRKIRDDVELLMNNLQSKYRYSAQGAKEICVYVIDNELAARFEGNT